MEGDPLTIRRGTSNDSKSQELDVAQGSISRDSEENGEQRSYSTILQQEIRTDDAFRRC